MTTKKPPGRRAKAASKNASDSVNVFDAFSIEASAVSLLNVEFSHSLLGDVEKSAHKIGCSIENYVGESNRSIGFCEFSIRRVTGEEQNSALKARYIYSISSNNISSEKIRRSSIELFTKLSLWPRFKSLFGMINLQSDASFPKLPMTIPLIEYTEHHRVKSKD